MNIAEWSFHGGRIARARAAYGDGPWLDLSTGINPHVWPGADGIAIDWRTLPDDNALAELERVAAAAFGVDADHVCAVPGSEIGLRLVGDLIGGAGVRIGPGYRTHAEMIAGARTLSAAALEDAIDATIVLANPNNPDGRITPRALIEAHVARFAGTPHWVIVDEAYADACPECSVAGDVHDRRPLVVVRSFGKFYGLAGVRLGFVIGPRDLLARLRARLGNWPVSAAAIAFGAAAYADRAFAEAMRARLRADAAALDTVLARHGLRAVGDCPLFRLLTGVDGAALFDRLARAAILTRPFAEHPDRLRIGLPGDAATLARLDRALGDG